LLSTEKGVRNGSLTAEDAEETQKNKQLHQKKQSQKGDITDI